MSHKGLTFEKALAKIKAGHKARRAGWNYANHVGIEHGELVARATQKFSEEEVAYRYTASHDDMMTDDWEIVD